MFFRLVFIATVCGLLGACATVTKGVDDTVKFESTPIGATATANEMTGKLKPASCVSPCQLELNRKYTYMIEFTLDGYETTSQRIEPRLSGDGAAGMAGNVLIGGIIGAGVDAATGAMNDLKPNPVAVTLVRAGSPAPDEDMAEPSTDVQDDTAMEMAPIADGDAGV